VAKLKQMRQIACKKIKDEYGGLIWVGPGIVGVHELSHIIVGKGLNMRYGWYGFSGFSVHREIPQPMFGSIGVYVNEVTPWTLAAGLIGSLLWIAVMRRYGSIFGFHMTKQTFLVGLLYAFWIAKWDLNWLAGEILKISIL
jgi:hypothetical protein